MTTKELFEQFIEEARVGEYWVNDGKQMMDRITKYSQELEASIRKEVIAEIRTLDVVTSPAKGILEQKIRKEVVDITRNKMMSYEYPIGADYVAVQALSELIEELEGITLN